MKIIIDESDFKEMPTSIQFQLRHLALKKMDIGNDLERHTLISKEEEKLIKMHYIDFLKMDQSELFNALFMAAPQFCKNGSNYHSLEEENIFESSANRFLLKASGLPWEHLFNTMLEELGGYFDLDGCTWDENSMRITIDDKRGMISYFGNDMSNHDFRKERYWGKALLFIHLFGFGGAIPSINPPKNVKEFAELIQFTGLSAGKEVSTKRVGPLLASLQNIIFELLGISTIRQQGALTIIDDIKKKCRLFDYHKESSDFYFCDAVFSDCYSAARELTETFILISDDNKIAKYDGDWDYSYKSVEKKLSVSKSKHGVTEISDLSFE